MLQGLLSKVAVPARLYKPESILQTLSPRAGVSYEQPGAAGAKCNRVSYPSVVYDVSLLADLDCASLASLELLSAGPTLLTGVL